MIKTVFDYIRTASSLPRDPDRAQVRLVSAIITGIVMWKMVLEPMMYIIDVETPSVMFRVAASTGRPLWYAGAYLLFSVCIAPHLIDLICRPRQLGRYNPRQWATSGMIGAGIVWGMMGYRASKLDFDTIQYNYMVNGVLCFVVAFAYGYSINAQQAKEQEKAESAKLATG